MDTTIHFELNGRRLTLSADLERTLLWVLRDELRLTGTKYGCGEGFCGACTIMLEGKAVRSCLTSLKDIAGKSVTTVEGLSRRGALHPLQEAFIEHGAFQCGFCTPGMLLSAAALLYAVPHPSREMILSHMEGNLCRCGAHQRIMSLQPVG